MAKQLGSVILFITGDENGCNSARFEYQVTHTDDSSLVKYASLEVSAPVFTVDTVEDFFDGYVSTIKSNESIA
jgi:hypothetical protein